MLAHVDLPTIEALNNEWRLHPPVHHLVAAYLDYKPPSQASAQQTTVTDFEDLLSEIGNVPIRTVAPIDTTAFDAAMKEKNHG